MESQNVILIKPPENPNTTTVRRLYEALANGDTKLSTSLIANDLEWWFHGPQNRHHMMKTLTGQSSPSDFTFAPRGVEAIDGERVIVEGWEGAHVYWVHVWTMKDGVITQLREYFNTWLTVRDLRPFDSCLRSTTADTLWRSHREDRSLPG